MTPNDIRCGDAVRYMSVPRGLKYRPDGAIRVVPIPPVLVRMLRQHLFDSDEGHVIALSPRAWVPVFASLGQALGARSSPAFIPTGGGTKKSRFAMLTSPALRV